MYSSSSCCPYLLILLRFVPVPLFYPTAAPDFLPCHLPYNYHNPAVYFWQLKLSYPVSHSTLFGLIRKDSHTIIPTRINTIKRIPDIPGVFTFHRNLLLSQLSLHQVHIFLQYCQSYHLHSFLLSAVYLLGKLLMRPLLKCNAYF